MYFACGVRLYRQVISVMDCLRQGDIDYGLSELASKFESFMCKCYARSLRICPGRRILCLCVEYN